LRILRLFAAIKGSEVEAIKLINLLCFFLRLLQRNPRIDQRVTEIG